MNNIPLLKLKPNPINATIYDDTDLNDLKNSIEANGQLEPLIINKKNEIISGHRRYYSMVQLGYNQAEVRVADYENDTIALIEHNRHRTKSVKDILRESRVLEKELKEKLGGRGKRTDLNGTNKFRLVDEMAKSLGYGLSKLKQLRTIANYAPDMIDKIDKEYSLNQAYEIVREKFLGGKKKSSKVDFETSFKKILKNHSPDIEEINSVLKTTYPYNLNYTDETTLVENPPKLKELKKKRTELIDNLMFKQSLDSRELVMFNKLNEFQQNGFDESLMKSLKDTIWQPTDIFDTAGTIIEISNIKPKIMIADNDVEFNHLRRLIHSFEWVNTVGRLIKLIVKDETTDKVLGIITLGSDLVNVECRENWIGWTEHHKHHLKKLNHTAVVSSIVPVQPFGFNMLGGKLIACLSTTDLIRKIWKDRYDDELIGLTTTSLFGSFSMYNNIPHWKKLGVSKGKVYIKPDKEIYQFWLDFIRENHRDKYDKIMIGIKTGAKQKMLNLIFNQLGIKASDYFINQQRGIYFAPFYQNTNEYLRDEISEKDLVMKPQISGGMDYLMKWWKPKAINRYKKLLSSDRLENEILWYENIADNKATFNQWLSSKGSSI